MVNDIFNRLAALRGEMEKRGVDGFFVPRADEFQGEYVPASAERLQWITGFTGSSGQAVILKDKAAFFTDGRYTLQAREQVDAKAFEVCSISENQSPTPTMTPVEWIERKLSKEAKFAISAWLHTPAETKRIKEAVERAGGELVLLDDNPLDAAWQDRPAAPLTPAVPHALIYAGKSSHEKRDEVAAVIKSCGAKALLVTLPEEICWLFNVRGNDVPCTPFVLSYAVLHENGTADWFVDARKVGDETKAWVGQDVRLHPLEDFASFVASLAKSGGKIWVDSISAPVKAEALVLQNGAHVHAEKSPIQLMKAKKNATEIAGAIKAHIRDGVAETRFLSRILAEGAAEQMDEMSASDMLEKLRSEGENFRGLSFDTISGAGGNGAIVHYRSTPETNQKLTAGPVYLLDSGAQYLEGTTDITRTLAVGKVTAEQKDRFTRVLKGHIQVASAVFPEGTTGDKLDVKARAALKEVGLDFAHGTGHGVGSYLSVHEGPCGISPRATSTPFEVGMIVSNEPGYYKTGEYGIRIENLVTVIDTGKKDTDGKRLLGFKTLTMVPIDRHLIEVSLLTADERAWLDNYHREVLETLTPFLKGKDDAALTYLEEATRPLVNTIIQNPRITSLKT